MDIVLSSDDDILNPEYIEGTKSETVKKAVKTIKSRSAKKLRGRPKC